MTIKTKAYDLWWDFRYWLARRMVHLAHKFDEDVGVDIFRGRECEEICLDIWHGKLTDKQEIRRRIYASQY